MKKLAALMAGLLAGFLPAAGFADQAMPLLYSRSTIAIVRHQPVALPWLPKARQETARAAASHHVTFDVEVRDATTLYNQKGWFNLKPPAENGGVLMMFAAPTLSAIVPAAQYAPLDILMINPEGTIIQIVPNIRLSDLQQDITPSSPVLAFLFLRGGVCKKFSISPGDSVDYPKFKKQPVVLSITPPVAPTRDVVPPTPNQ